MTTLSPIMASAVTYQPTATAAKAEAESLPQTTASDKVVSLPQEAFALCGNDGCQRLNKLANTVSSQITPSSLVQGFNRLITQIQKTAPLSSGVKINAGATIADVQSARQKNLKALSGTLTALSATINKNTFQTDCSVSKVAGQCQGLANAMTSVSVSTDDSNTSYADFWAKIADDLGSINTDYVEFYANLMEKYTEVYQAFQKVQAAEAACITEGADGNHVHFDAKKLHDAFVAFEATVNGLKFGTVPNWDNMTADQQAEMKTTLAPTFTVDKLGNISADMTGYNNVKDNWPSGTFSNLPGTEEVFYTNADISTAEYNAWLTSFNTIGSTFQSNMQSFAQRYSQANTTFDNLNKVLSSAITSLSDSLKGFLTF